MESVISISSFLKAYIKSMRLYYSFVTGIAGLVGLLYYQYVANSQGFVALSNIPRTSEVPTSATKMTLIMLILFLAWGINQIFNDYLGLEEDRLNAPDRPMVTGELNPYYAMLLSGLLMLVAVTASWFFLEKESVIPLIAGALLNVVYEYAKGYGICGNIVFGLMISACAMFGFMAAGPSEYTLITPARITMLLYIALINALMTYYTYFKDYEGDKAAGKRTLIVKYGLDKSRIISIIGAFLPSIVFILSYFVFNLWPIELNNIFILLGILTIVLQFWTGYLFYKNPVGEMTYFSLSMNFRACTCCEATIIALFNPALSIILFFSAYYFIGFLFNFHVNNKG